MPTLRTDIPAINMDGYSWSGGAVVDLMDIARRRINMTDVTGTRERDSNALEAVIENSKAGLLFLALILPDHSPRTVIVNRGTLARVPNERNDGEGAVRRPIKKVLRIGLRGNGPAILLLQPIGLRYKTSQERLDCKDGIFRFPALADHRFYRHNEIT